MLDADITWKAVTALVSKALSSATRPLDSPGSFLGRTPATRHLTSSQYHTIDKSLVSRMTPTVNGDDVYVRLRATKFQMILAVLIRPFRTVESALLARRSAVLKHCPARVDDAEVRQSREGTVRPSPEYLSDERVIPDCRERRAHRAATTEVSR